VDPVSRREFWKLLAEVLSRGLTIVMATPYLDGAERCPPVARLHARHLLALPAPPPRQGTPAGPGLEVTPATPPPAVQRPSPAPAIEPRSRVPGVIDVQSFGDRAHVRIARGSAERVIAAIESAMREAHIPLVSVRPIAASLEDVFIELITGGPR